MRFCTNCGTRLPENGKFCIECGQKVPEPVAEVPVQPVPPVEPVPVPPVKENYVPPVQETYVPPVQYNTVPAAPVKKKPFDKKLLIPIILVPVLVVVGIAVLLMSLFGADKVDEDVLGMYYAMSCEVDGFETEPEDEWLELKTKGKMTLMLADEEYDGKWTLDGKDLTLECDGDTFEGKLKNGAIEIDIDDMAYVFVREDLISDQDKEEPKATEPAVEEPTPVGYWTLLRADSDNPDSVITEEDVQMLKDMGVEVYLQLHEDGTGQFSFDTVEEVTWTDTEIIGSDGSGVPYEFKDGQMFISIEDVVMVMVPGEPSAEAPSTEPVGYQSEPGTYTAYYGYSEGTEVYEEELAAVGGVSVTFYGDGTGMVSLAGEVFDMTYDESYIYCDGNQMEYYRYEDSLDLYVDDETWFYLSNGEVSYTGAGDDAILEDMNGDWYGWWAISEVYEGDTEMVGNWWDACASLYMNWDGTAEMILWDEDTTWSEPLATVTLEVTVQDNGVVGFVSTGGDFMGNPVEYGEWIFYSNDTEYINTLGFFGEYQEEGLSMEFYFFLRPWGTLWDDIAQIDSNDMPYYYYDWYLPLLEEGWTDAPASMELP